MINTKGIEKWKVLKALYDNSRPLGMGILHYDPSPMTEAQAKEYVKRNTDLRIDYLQGRVMKVNLAGDEFDEWLYDRDNGPGAALKAISAIA